MVSKNVLQLFRTRSSKAGLAPGTLVHIGDKKTDEVKITVYDYDKTNLRELQIQKAEECIPLQSNPGPTWINIDGIHKLDIIESFGKVYNLHPLLLEDIVNTAQRPKLEDYDNYLFIVLKMLTRCDTNNMEVENVSLVLGNNFLFSFQEKQGDVFDAVRNRLKSSKGSIRSKKADYLAYSLMDSIVDQYFSILERTAEEIETMEEDLITDPRDEMLHKIHQLKREMIFLRKSIWPMREIMRSLQKDESPLIDPATAPYFRDVNDHIIQVTETIDIFRDMLSGMLDIYLSSVNNRMNETMKVLTLIATIFIPLSFIAGIYGMNFKYIPELEWRYGYFAVLGAMFTSAAVLIVFFRKKKWI